VDTHAAPLAPRELPGVVVTVTREEVRQFASSTFNAVAVHNDLEAARAAGHPDLVVPPTYLFSLEFRRPDPYGVLRELGVDRSQALHAEQSFSYSKPCFAGDTLKFTPRLTEDYSKKGGALRFLVRETTVERDGEHVAELRNVLVLRQGAPA